MQIRTLTVKYVLAISYAVEVEVVYVRRHGRPLCITRMTKTPIQTLPFKLNGEESRLESYCQMVFDSR